MAGQSARAVLGVTRNNLQGKLVATALVAMATVMLAASVAPTFYKQNDPRWRNEKVGTSKFTLGQIGCAVTSGANALALKGIETNPSRLNKWLTANKGYVNQNSLVWSKINEYSNGQLTWVGVGSLPKTPAELKALLKSGLVIIAYSRRAESVGLDHWVTLLPFSGNGSRWADFYYVDPLDGTSVIRRVNDGWVSAGNRTRQYR